MSSHQLNIVPGSGLDGSPGGSNQNMFMKNPAIISHYEGNFDGGNHHSRLPNHPSIAPEVVS